MKRNRATEKGKMLVEESQPDADMDELLAVLGYKVKSSDMADVALKLQQLEMLMCNNSRSNNTSSEYESSHLSNETVHYNQSDLSGWEQSMLVERKNINPKSNNIDFGSGSRNVVISFSNDQENQVGGNVFDDDLSAIPGKDVLRNGNLQTLEDGAEKK
ncbi:hypothetical protein LIER_39260 [Lithospermum erythrorhizon]|uniref:Transcriptional factor DELLA N-terminal domain-containing protein n=1 Tax=Lithospermum erythrorhizon TaxID=34254 RepID=A0AAV3QEJ3_LITER